MSNLLDKRVVFVTGKGGTGKSTVAISLGIAAAARGKRTIVCEVASEEHLSRTLRRAEIGFHEVELRDNLWGISIDPDRSMREYILLQVRVRAMGDLLYRSRIFSYLAAATPGLREMVTIGKIWELAQPERKADKRARPYDLVIVDAPATGHGVGFLQTPRNFAQIARVGPIHAQAKTIGRFITDADRAGAVIVALPEEMPVNESAMLERELTGVGVAVDRVYMNALYEERFSDAEVERIRAACESAEGAAGAALRAALSQHRRAETEREQLGRLREMVSAPIASLPFLFEPELGTDELELLASEVV